MGDIKRKRKLFVRPKKIYDKERIDTEKNLVKKYGLKNRKEIWKAKTAISRFRSRAKKLIGKDEESQRKFLEKLNKMGLNVIGISDILALNEENLLDRRLETFVVRKKLARTQKQARQLIVHKNVLVEGKIINVPSFLVTRDLEDKIKLKTKKVKLKKEMVGEENGKE